MGFGRPDTKARSNLGHLALTALVWVAAASSAHGQGLPRTPVAPPPPQGSPLPGIAPSEQPGVGPGLPQPARPTAPAPSAEGATHPISTVEVDGVTAFSKPEVAQLTGGLTGPAVPEGKVEAARTALVDLYRSQGYLYTTVRAVISGTELRFRVIEGYVADVKLEGDIGPAGTQVLRFLNHLVGQVPLKAASLERWLLLAQDIPGLTVHSVLRPSLGDPGVLTLVAEVSRRPVSGYVSADNRAYNLTGPEEGLGVINFDSFSEFGERTQLSMFGAFDQTNVFGQASEELFLGGSGLKLRLYGGAGASTPSGQLKTIGYNGETRVFGAQLSYPWVRSREQSLNLIAVFDALESNIQNELGPNGTEQRASFDSLRMLRLGTDYALFDILFGPGHSAVNDFSAKFSQGLTILGASGNHEITAPRLGEKPDFSKINGGAARTQTLVQWADGRSLKLHEAFEGQFTGDLLPPSEKYYLGGPHFNSGYYYGQVSGDKAANFSNELQFNIALPLPKRVPFEVTSQFYVFYDWGKVWQNDPTTEANVTLQSAGGGVRLFVANSAEVDLEGVYRMNRYPNGQGPSISALSSTAFYWQVLFQF